MSAEASVEPGKEPSDEPAKPRILLVEDEFIIASVTADMLTELGYEVAAVVGSQRQALDLIPTMEFDAAVLDIVLRTMDSMPVAEVLRQRGIPFGFASAWSNLMADSPFNDVPSISKPYNLDQLRGFLKNVLGDRALQ